MKDKDLRKELAKELTDPSKTLVESYAEIALDSDLAEGVLKDIPLVSTLFALGKAGLAINQILFLKKISRFLKGLRSSGADAPFVIEFREKLRKEPDLEEKVTGHVLEFVDKSFDDERIEAFACLFNAFVDQRIDWDSFRDLTFILYNLSPTSFPILRQFGAAEPPFSTNTQPSWEGYFLSAGIAHRHGNHLAINERGKQLFDFAISKLS